MKNGLGLTGFILGIIAIVFALIPYIGIIAWPLSILGIVFSGVGVGFAFNGKADNKGIAISGLAVSVVALALCFIWVAGLAASAA